MPIASPVPGEGETSRRTSRKSATLPGRVYRLFCRTVERRRDPSRPPGETTPRELRGPSTRHGRRGVRISASLLLLPPPRETPPPARKALVRCPPRSEPRSRPFSAERPPRRCAGAAAALPVPHPQTPRPCLRRPARCISLRGRTPAGTVDVVPPRTDGTRPQHPQKPGEGSAIGRRPQPSSSPNNNRSDGSGSTGLSGSSFPDGVPPSHTSSQSRLEKPPRPSAAGGSDPTTACMHTPLLAATERAPVRTYRCRA